MLFDAASISLQDFNGGNLLRQPFLYCFINKLNANLSYLLHLLMHPLMHRFCDYWIGFGKNALTSGLRLPKIMIGIRISDLGDNIVTGAKPWAS